MQELIGLYIIWLVNGVTAVGGKHEGGWIFYPWAWCIFGIVFSCLDLSVIRFQNAFDVLHAALIVTPMLAMLVFTGYRTKINLEKSRKNKK